VEDSNGKVKTRMVSMESQRAKMVFFNSIQYLDENDMEEASKYFKNPEEYDFKKILKW
jgi:6-phosphofructokinase 1